MNITFPQGIAYDSSGNVIEVPEGHAIVYGKDECSFVKIDNYSAHFVYKKPDMTSEKYKLAQKMVENEKWL